MTPEEPDLRAALEARLQFDALLADLASRFVNLPASAVWGEIMAAQQRLCEALGLDRSSIWEVTDGEAGVMQLMHIVQPTDLPVPAPRMDARVHFPFLVGEMLQGRAVVIPRVDDLPPEAARDRDTLRQYGTKATIVFPLRAGAEVFGAVGFAMTRAERDWKEPVVRRLGLVAQIFADALGRKRSDDELRKSKDRMRLAADAAGAGLWELDLATGRFWATEKAWELIGVPPDAALSYDQCLNLVHPEDRPAVDEAVRAALASQHKQHVDCRVVRPDGTIRWIQLSGHPRCGESGDPVSIMGASTDVTARKEAEAALREVSGRLILAQEQERAWLAKELHDGLSQNLALLAVELDLLGQQPSITGDQLRARMSELSAQTRALSGEVHRLSHGLHPAKLERLGLVAALSGFCREVETVENLMVQFEARNVPRVLPENLVLCLYRVAQEALWNVAKHSGARNATVELSGSADEIRLRISDDGRGFDPKSPKSQEGLGLLSMRERVGIVGGKLQVESAPGDGTLLQVSVALRGGEVP